MATPPERISEYSRRHFLGLTASAAGIASAATLLPPSLVSAAAQGRPAGSLEDVEHIVVLMQENRSFDHYFGTMRGVRGFADNSAKPGVFLQSGVHPFLAREAANRGSLSVEYLASLPHEWADGQQALAGGRCDGWVAAKGKATMACYDRRDIPFHHALAETFTVCDGYFASSPTGTGTNRNYLFSGTSGFEPWGARSVGNEMYAPVHPGLTWETYAESLHREGVDWRVYQEWDNFTDNNLDFFAHFRGIGRDAVARAGQLGVDLTGFYTLLIETGAKDAHGNVVPSADQRSRARAVHRAARGLGEQAAELYDRALHRSEPGTLVPRFRRDVESGRLPAVSWIVTSEADSEHPRSSSPVQSAGITYRLLDALASNPEVWRKTVVLLNYDEFDGYFDHVVPPLPPVGEADEWWEGKPMGLGFRVPMTIVSPWTVGGRVCSEVFDHTSVIRLMEAVTGVRCPNISAWRRAVCGDLVSTFDFGRTDGLRVPAQPAPPPPFRRRWTARPGGAAPTQETGTATALPTPYRLSANVVDGVLELVNTGRRAAVFGVFADGDAAHHTVLGRRRVPLPQRARRVVVTGPDRFLRDLSLRPGGSSAQVMPDHDRGRLSVDGRDVTATRVHGSWYEVTVVGPEGRQYFTGRLESGAVTRTSPLRRPPG
ncbi:alkaline phosphatase family protein [Gordonia sihwensis]|uniref:alkaline phosphatase family protein n=1 Tax=Gordonia sihwensis TaxID=173559 RepID=UPI0024178C04|nr:alkaline phosphatase family protein [Gordonia sihwensis]WFN92642.1 alkaline phosphatase family protein [Gordonia sihwensis]